MDTLKDDLERAVPHVDPGPDGVDGLVAAGRRAVRRRRVAAVGLLAGGGLVAASLAIGATTPDDQREARDPAMATAPGAPQPSATKASGVPLSLESLVEAAGECPRSAGGGDPERVVELRDAGRWSAVELACGDGTVRVLRTPDGELVGRYRVEHPRTLEEWAEANVDRVAP